MSLTSHATLRDRLLTYLAGVGGSSTPSDTLSALESLYDGQWTAGDLLPQPTRRSETKWRNRVSSEQQRLVDHGVLQARSDGIWALATGFGVARVDLAKLNARNAEIRRREQLWLGAKGVGAPEGVPASELENLRLRAGGRGVYVDVPITRGPIAPAGITVSLLDLGEAYANERNVDGVSYQLPATSRAGRDRAEIDATVRAYELAMPVFMILPGPGSRTRSVRRSIVENIDLDRNVALVTFIDDEPLPPEPATSGGEEFELVMDNDEARWGRRRSRPNQARFAFDVLQRYGTRCAVCDVAASPAIEAAHIRPKELRGADDARNGLPLCSNHHRLYDAGWLAFEPITNSIVFRNEQMRREAAVVRTDLNHLRAQPSEVAIADAWSRR